MAIECRKCIFFGITWEKDRPYSCRSFGFKSLKIPSIEVLNAAGKECLKFSPKKMKKQ